MFSTGLFANHGVRGTVILTLILQLLIMYVPFLQTIFKTTSLNWSIMRTILLITLGCVLLTEMLKYLNKKMYYKKTVAPEADATV
jgi:P-type Ca2+ transporter type 2C